VLAALSSLRDLLDAEDDLAGLTTLEAQIKGQAPEEINDGKTSAPSKRLLTNIPSYQETLHGPAAVQRVGLAAIRKQCPRLDAWVCQLEGLAK